MKDEYDYDYELEYEIQYSLEKKRICNFYEMDENFDDLNFLNTNNSTNDTKRELTEDEMCLSLAHIMLMKKWELDESNDEDLRLKDTHNEGDEKEEEKEDNDNKKKNEKEEVKKVDKKQITKFKKAAKRYLRYKDTAKKGGTLRGIYIDLEKKLGLDLHIKETDSSKEKFDKLKLLKQICVAEKLGVYRTGEINNENLEFLAAIPLMDIIRNPKLKNKHNEYGYDSLYANEFEIVYNNVKSQVPNAEEIEKQLYSIHDQWNKILNLTFNEVSLSSFSSEKSKSIKAQRDLIKKIPVEFDEFLTAKESCKSSTGVMERFFIMMVTAKIRAEINDYCKIVFSYSMEEDSAENENNLLALLNTDKVLDNSFLMNYVRSEFYATELTVFEFIEKMEKGNYNDRLNIWKLILIKDISEIPDIKNTDTVIYNKVSNVDRLERVARLWMNDSETKTFKMPVDKWCIVFRELMYIYLKNESISTYNQKGESTSRDLSAIITSLNPERNVKNNESKPVNSSNRKRKPRTERKNRQEAHSNMALKKRLNNRLLLIYSSPEIVDCRNEMEKHVLSIESKVLSYQTMDEIENANRIMLYVTALYSQSTEELASAEAEYNRTQFYDCNLTFPNPNNFHHFFSAIIVDNYFVLSDRPKELIEAEKDICTFKPMIDGIYNEQYLDTLQNPVLIDKLNEFLKLSKKYKLHRNLTDLIIKELYNSGKITIGNNGKSVEIFGIDGEQYNMQISYVNCYSSKQIVINDVRFDDDVQKVLDIIKTSL